MSFENRQLSRLSPEFADDSREHDSDGGSSSINPTRKRSHESEVWNYFEKIVWNSDGGRKTAKCTVDNCNQKAFSCGSSGTTKPLWRHLENAHFIEYVQTEDYLRKGKRQEGETEV
jgi:hypothetical protein